MTLVSVDEWIAHQPEPRPTRPEAIRRLVEKGLAADGVGDAMLDRQIAEQEVAKDRKSQSARLRKAAK